MSNTRASHDDAGHLEPVSAVLRIGGAYGEPYTWAATVRYFTPVEVELMGVLRAPTVSEWKAIRTVLMAAGIEAVRFNRRRGDVADERRLVAPRAKERR